MGEHLNAWVQFKVNWNLLCELIALSDERFTGIANNSNVNQREKLD